MFPVHFNDLLHFVIATHEDTGSIMDVLRNYAKHTIHMAVDCLPASCNGVSVRLDSRFRELKSDLLTILENHGHWRALIQDTQLAFWTLHVCRISEDATIE